MNQTYKHSGKFGPIGIAAGMVTGLVAGFPLAYVYAWGIIKIDEQKLACIATLTYGALLGVAAGMGLKWGKVRNSITGGVLAIIPAAMSLYWSWAFWAKNIVFNFEKEDLDAIALMTHPRALWEVIKLINENGTWGTTSTDLTKGTELWFFWGLEAFAVLAVAAAVAYAILEALPFCEKCGLWCSSTEKLLLSASDPGQTRQSLAKRDLSFLEKLGPGNQKTSHMTAQLHSCANCGELNTLTLQQTTIVQTSKWRKPTVSNVNLAVKFLLSRVEADAFRSTAHNMKQLAKAAHA